MPRLLFSALIGLFAFVLSLPNGAAFAQEGYRVRSGDILRVEVLEDPSLNRSVLVAPDGRITLPMAGGISAGGRSLDVIQNDLATRLAPNFAAAPTVYVALERQKDILPQLGGAPAAPPTIDIYVVGEAARPGKLQVSPGTTVLQLFAQMGGFTKFAATKRIQLRRGDSNFLLNYKAIEAGSNKGGATVLSNGDVIVVPQRHLFE